MHKLHEVGLKVSKKSKSLRNLKKAKIAPTYTEKISLKSTMINTTFQN